MPTVGSDNVNRDFDLFHDIPSARLCWILYCTLISERYRTNLRETWQEDVDNSLESNRKHTCV